MHESSCATIRRSISRCAVSRFGAIASISFPALGLAFAKILTIFYYPNPGALWTSAWVWALLMLVISVVSVVCDATSSYAIGAVGAHLTKNLRQLSMTTWLKQDMSFFDDDGNSSGDLTEFLGENITLVQSLLSEKLATTVRNFFTLVTGLVLMFLLSPWELVLFVLGCLPVMAVMMGLQVMIFTGQDEAKQGKQTDQMKADRSAGALVGEVVLAIRTVASFNAEHALPLVNDTRLAHVSSDDAPVPRRMQMEEVMSAVGSTDPSALLQRLRRRCSKEELAEVLGEWLGSCTHTHLILQALLRCHTTLHPELQAVTMAAMACRAPPAARPFCVRARHA